MVMPVISFLRIFQALEGVGESLQVSSQDIDPLREDDADPGSEYGTEGSEIFIRSDGENNGDSVGIKELALPDNEWISPPASISSGSEESGATSVDASLADSFSGLDLTEEKGDHSHSSESSVTEVLESRPEEAHSGDMQV